jgi:hypothetical protein
MARAWARYSHYPLAVDPIRARSSTFLSLRPHQSKHRPIALIRGHRHSRQLASHIGLQVLRDDPLGQVFPLAWPLSQRTAVLSNVRTSNQDAGQLLCKAVGLRASA